MANKISVSALIAMFQLMEAEHWSYEWGACKRNVVDCAGAFKWAFEQHGRSLYQGSNRMARVEVDALIPIGVANIVPGMAAFKCRAPGASNYDLKACYKPGGEYYTGDVNDYYHVGLVDADTTIVLNAQSSSTGFVASPISKGWTHVGYLKQVDYGADVQVGLPEISAPTLPDSAAYGTAVTTAPSGSTVNLRAAASTSAKLVDRVPLRQTVTLLSTEISGWYRVRWGKLEGYIKAEYLALETSAPAQPEEYSSYALELYDLTYQQAVKLQEELKGYKSRIEGRNG